MNRVPHAERDFEDVYNRIVEVYQELKHDDDKNLVYAKALIKSNGDQYTITEYFTKDGKTDYILAGLDENLKRYKTYIEAEMNVARSIGVRKVKTSG